MSYESVVERNAQAFCENGRVIGPDQVTGWFDFQGRRETFITFRCGPTPEGVEGARYKTLSEAYTAFTEAFTEYAKGKEGHLLYWRTKPKVEKATQFEWHIYARLVLVEVKEKENE